MSSIKFLSKNDKLFGRYLEKILDLINFEFPYVKFKTEKLFRNHLSKKHIKALVALNKNRELVGYCEYALFKKTCRINAIVISKNFRGKGYAKKLMDKVLRNLPKRIENVKVIVWDDNFIAINLYKKLGFKYLRKYKSVMGRNSSIYKLQL